MTLSSTKYRIKNLHLLISGILLTVFLLPGCTGTPKQQSDSYSADVIVYGGTSAAVIAAVEVVHSGKTVIMVSPDVHPGGLTSGGLGYTDTGDKSVIGGLSREFYHRVWLHYNDSSAWIWQKQSEYGNKGQGTVRVALQQPARSHMRWRGMGCVVLNLSCEHVHVNL